MTAARLPYLLALLVTGAGVATVGSAQTMIEYGHLGGAGATGAAGAAKAAPTGPLRKLHGSLARRVSTPTPPIPPSMPPEPPLAEPGPSTVTPLVEPSPVAAVSFSESSSAPAVPAPAPALSVSSASAGWGDLEPAEPPAPPVREAPVGLLTILRTSWGPDALETPSPVADSETSLEPRVLEADAPRTSFDLAAAGLRTGMEVSEVMKILGDPDVRTRGLAGRGYDEKALYRLDSGWLVTVYASHGRALDFLASPDPEKSKESVLLGRESVVP